MSRDFLGTIGYIKGLLACSGMPDIKPPVEIPFEYENFGATIEGDEATFGEGKYILIKDIFNPENNGWKISYRLKTGAEVAGSLQVPVGSSSNYESFITAITPTGGAKLWVDYTGQTNWEVDAEKDSFIKPETEYTVTLSYDKDKYHLTWKESNSPEGVYAWEYVSDSGEPMYSKNPLAIGCLPFDNQTWFKGIVYLSSFKFIINP